ncbi:MAG: RNA polymerase sigma factor FliA [Deltaproteobacteria bacterium]|nr:RNA polymerase sigma factor FliA [Deltaproteobacteria bacterium]HCH62836.1 RNA polymerase sigma factor FliA [Deltaproteobacteria bacterium]
MPAHLALAHATNVETTTLTTEQLVLKNLPLIRTIAKRLVARLPPSVEAEELVNIGVIGLLDAWERFDASKGVPFRSYAELRIKGQMIDSLRSDDIVPRSVRRKHTRLTQERSELTHRLGRTPNREEMRLQLDMTPKAYDAYVSDSRIAKVTSLDAPANDDSATPLVETLSLGAFTAEDTLDEKQIRAAVAEAVAMLPERERAVVTMYYVEHQTLRQIGQMLGVTESRACQIRSQGVKRLKFRLRALRG